MKLPVKLYLPVALLLIAGLLAFHSSHAQTPRRIDISAKRFAFSPDEITLKRGQPVVLVLKCTDVAHGLRFRELGLNIKANKGQTAELPFTPTKVGDFVGQCSVFCGAGHGRMKLILHVVE